MRRVVMVTRATKKYIPGTKFDDIIKLYYFDQELSSPPKNNGLYQILLAMKYLRASDDEWREFVEDLDKLFQKYAGVISLSVMNLSTDWKPI